MSQNAPARVVTRAEFDQIASLAENAARHLQLINGEIVESMPKYGHSRIASLLHGWLFVYLNARRGAGVALVEMRVDLPGDDANARVPDLCVVTSRAGELAALAHDASLPIMPDLVVEIQSPGQTDAYMDDTAAYYLSHGARMVWLAYPDRQRLDVLTPQGRRTLTREGALDGGAVLPGFLLDLRDVFS